MSDYSVELDVLHRLSDERSAPPASLSALGFQAAALEAFLIIGAALVSQALYTTAFWGAPSDLEAAAGAGFAMATFFVLIAHARGLYGAPLLFGGARAARKLAGAWLLTFLIAAMSAFLLKVGEEFSRGAVLTLFSLGAVAIAASRLTVAQMARSREARGVSRRSVALFYDPSRRADETIARLQRTGLRVARCAPLAGSSPDARALFAGLQDLIRSGRVDEIIVDAPVRSAAELDALSLRFRGLPVPVRLAPDPELASLLRRPVAGLGDLPLFDLQRPALSLSERAVKRAIDLTLAGAAIAALWPLLAVIALAIKLETPGPVIFSQTRVGARGRLFRIHKFRSMRVMDDGAVVRQARRDDPRVTRVGRWIRATSLDELPQLFNVMKGDMSIVGPRPHALAHDVEFGALIESYTMRHHAKPGITGLAQVSGLRGETPTVELMAQRIDLDIRYIAEWSVWLDLMIILRTARALASVSKVY